MWATYGPLGFMRLTNYNTDLHFFAFVLMCHMITVTAA